MWDVTWPPQFILLWWESMINHALSYAHSCWLMDLTESGAASPAVCMSHDNRLTLAAGLLNLRCSCLAIEENTISCRLCSNKKVSAVHLHVIQCMFLVQSLSSSCLSWHSLWSTVPQSYTMYAYSRGKDWLQCSLLSILVPPAMAQ